MLKLVQSEGEQQPLTTFANFWSLYPRKVARKAAERAWSRVARSDYPALFSGLILWRKEWLRRGEIEYIPHAATWLNGERWTDELPASIAATANAHIPFADKSEKFVRGEIPDHVKTQMRKLLQS